MHVKLPDIKKSQVLELRTFNNNVNHNLRKGDLLIFLEPTQTYSDNFSVEPHVKNLIHSGAPAFSHSQVVFLLLPIDDLTAKLFSKM